MSKRKVRFAENGGMSEEVGEPSTRRFKEETPIDSDDENDDKGGGNKEIIDDKNILTEDDIEGQEEETIKSYDDIKITPFNLKEEMEEGHFDAEGNYIADKDAESFKDEWLESVDWAKVDEQEGKQMQEEWDDTQDVMPESEKLKTKKDIVNLLLPGESVLKALRRFGGKKTAKGKKDNVVDVDEKENKDKLLQLTEFADLLLQQGDFEIYSKTVEKLNVEIKREEEKFKDADEDDELEKAFAHGGAEDGEEKMEEKPVKDDEVMWEYKWNQSEDADIYGPYSNSCMIIWNEQGFFKDGVFCRKVGSEGSFYNSKRIDFDLYD